MSADGVGEVVDFMPIAGERATDRHRLVRMVRVVRGQMRFRLECEPRFDYGRDRAGGRGQRATARTFRGRTMTMNVSAVPPGPAAGPRRRICERTEHGVRAFATLDAGDVGGMVLETAPDGPAAGRPAGRDRAPVRADPRLLARAGSAGRSYQRPLARDGRALGDDAQAHDVRPDRRAGRGADRRAARAGRRRAQLGLPLHLDPGRVVLGVRAARPRLHRRGAGVPAVAQRPGAARPPSESAPLQIMYRIDGSPDLDEETLDHFEGYRGSSPVRIGNGAAGQLQLDIYGEALDSIHLADAHGLRMSHDGWTNTGAPHGLAVRPLGPARRRHLGDPRRPAGLRLRPAHVLGRLRPGDPAGPATAAARPTSAAGPSTRDAVYQQIMERGFHPKREAFVQHYDTDVLDASLLYMPLVGFIAPTDPMWQSTLRAMDEELVSDSLVYRYDPAASPDGLRGSEGTFTICSFWYVDALARSGRLDDARLTFEKMLTYGNHARACTRRRSRRPASRSATSRRRSATSSLISAAMNLDYQLDHGAGWVEPVLEHGITVG